MSAAFALVIATSLALAAPPDCPPSQVTTWIEDVRNGGQEAAYLCLANTPESRAALLDFLRTADSETHGARRVQRALALHVMQRLDEPADLVALRALNADDLRFLRDAVHARRGRQSPIEAHHDVFSKFSWYAPSRSYRSSMLTELDRANLVVIDKPPRVSSAPAVAPAADAMPTPPPSATPSSDASPASGCGCAAMPALPAAGLSLAVLWVAGRRRFPQTR